MPYDPNDKDSLPEHVRKLTGKKRRRWAHVFNSVFQETGDEGRAHAAANASLKKHADAQVNTLTFSGSVSTLEKSTERPMPELGPEGDEVRIGVPFAKVDYDRRLVYGLVTGEEIDKQGDELAYEGSLEALRNWAGNMREMHQPKAVGRRVRVIPLPEQRRIGLVTFVSRSPDGESTLTKIREGILTGYSIKGPPPLSTGKPRNPSARRRVEKWVCDEVSYVDNPAYGLSQLELVKNQVPLCKRDEQGRIVPTDVLGQGPRRSLAGLLIQTGRRHPRLFHPAR